MRGGVPAEPLEDNIGDDDQNSIMWFGCAENGGTDAASDMCEQFFVQLRAGANPANGSVKLPDALITWRPGNDGNMIPICKRSLRLIFADYEIDEAAAAAEAQKSVEAQQIAALQAQVAALEE